jgi:hypothetical protein
MEAFISCFAEFGMFFGIRVSAGAEGTMEYFLAFPKNRNLCVLKCLGEMFFFNKQVGGGGLNVTALIKSYFTGVF